MIFIVDQIKKIETFKNKILNGEGINLFLHFVLKLIKYLY